MNSGLCVVLALALVAAAPMAASAPPESAPAKGMLLVASRDLLDPNFRRTVVLLARHDEDGSLGLVLNVPITLTVAEAVPPLADTAAAGQRLYLGGPVALERVLYLFRRAEGPAGTVQVLPDVHLGGARATLQELLAQEPELPLRLFVGHAGWSAGQLAREMRLGSWHLLPATSSEVFGDPEGLWQRLIEQAAPSGILVRHERHD